jgi:outer membrane protein TolC
MISFRSPGVANAARMLLMGVIFAHPRVARGQAQSPPPAQPQVQPQTPEPTQPTAQELTLADVVRLALLRNERGKIAALDYDSANAAVARARAAFLPTISMAGSETLRPQPVEQNGRVVGRSNAASGSLTVNQPLLSLTAFPLYSAAKHNREAARYDEVNQRRQLAFDGARAFFGVIAQQRVLTAAKSRLDGADATYNDTRARAEAQLVSINDVTRAQIERASAVQSVANAVSSLEQARINLEYLLNMPIPEAVRAPDAALVPSGLEEGKLAGAALATRPDLASSIESAASAADSAEEPALRFVPTISVSGQARTGDQPVIGDRYVDTTVTFNLNWAIWDAGIRSADSDSRHAASAIADLQVQELRRRIGADVKAALSELQAARSSVDAAQQAVDAARRSADETTVLYKQGLAKAIELVDANLSRFDADVALAAAQLALRQAELDLRSALGLFPIDGAQ